jgi:hypothetical protein
MPSCGETSDDAREVHAFDAWSAAKRWAEWADGNSGAEMSQNGLRQGHPGYVVHILTPDNVETIFRVFPEAEVRWYAQAAGVVPAPTPGGRDAD